MAYLDIYVRGLSPGNLCMICTSLKSTDQQLSFCADSMGLDTASPDTEIIGHHWIIVSLDSFQLHVARMNYQTTSILGLTSQMLPHRQLAMAGQCKTASVYHCVIQKRLCEEA